MKYQDRGCIVLGCTPLTSHVLCDYELGLCSKKLESKTSRRELGFIWLIYRVRILDNYFWTPLIFHFHFQQTIYYLLDHVLVHFAQNLDIQPHPQLPP